MSPPPPMMLQRDTSYLAGAPPSPRNGVVRRVVDSEHRGTPHRSASPSSSVRRSPGRGDDTTEKPCTGKMMLGAAPLPGVGVAGRTTPQSPLLVRVHGADIQDPPSSASWKVPAGMKWTPLLLTRIACIWAMLRLRDLRCHCTETEWSTSVT